MHRGRIIRGSSSSADPVSLRWLLPFLLCPTVALAQSRPWHVGEELRHRSAVEDTVAVAAALIDLGRYARAAELLPADDGTPRVAGLRGLIAELQGDSVAAAALYRRAAELSRGSDRGIFLARSGILGASVDSSGALDDLAWAALMVPEISPWLRLHVAVLRGDLSLVDGVDRGAPEVPDPTIREARATILIRRGDHQALDELAELGYPHRAASLALAAGDSARARYYTVQGLGSDDREVRRASIEISDRLVLEDASARTLLGRVLVDFGRTDKAVPLLNEALNAGDSSVLFDLALARESSGPRETALELYRLAASGAGPDAVTAAYYHARLFYRLRRYDRALPLLRDFAERYPDDPRAPAASYLVGRQLHAGGNDVAATAVLREVAGRWPESIYTSRARQILIESSLERGDTSFAREVLEQEAEHGGNSRTYALYQLASLADSSSRRAALERLAEYDPLGYYGLLARHELGRELPAFEYEPPRASGMESVLRTMDLLERAGLQSELEDFIAAQMARPLSADETLGLAEGLAERGCVALSIRLGWRAAGVLGLRHGRVVRAIFPWPHRRLVVAEARKHGLDPYLVAAIVRQESSFEPGAVSRAGATGMMQLMPSTARGLARRLDVTWNDSYLSLADANVHLGSAHLAALMRRYDNDLVYSLTAYNAGGGNLNRWLRRRDAPADRQQFIEFVPFPETRGYLKAVLRNIELYRRLYPGEDQ